MWLCFVGSLKMPLFDVVCRCYTGGAVPVVAHVPTKLAQAVKNRENISYASQYLAYVSYASCLS